MSRDFKDYLVHVHRYGPDKKAAIMGTRFDAYGKGDKGKEPSVEKY